ncbi:MAG: class I SAM-dependent methyltransferase [Clostridia bacterium]|nr:class I SAM-dependent methyltransferase [Clostridia bacterium]
MNIKQIRENWLDSADKDLNASIEMWNSVSDKYNEIPIPDWHENKFLRLLNDFTQVSNEMSSLDIGCGAGNYSIALAEKVNKSVGIDLSPNMIAYAKNKATERGVNNVEFICEDWNAFDIKKAGFENSFDIVFAHMTPAICSAAAFEKMIACSKGYCLMAKPTRRKDSVLDQIRRIADLDETDKSFDEAISYAFDILWQLGYCPKFTYYDEVWESNKTPEEAYAWYIGRVKTRKKLAEADEARLKDYLQSIAVDGKIAETITTTIVTMYWQK